MRRQVDNRKRSLVELEVLHRMHARSQVQAGSDAPDVAADVHQDTVASAVDCFGSAMAVEGRTTLKKVAAKVGWLQPCEEHLLAQGTADAQIQQYVLGVERENEALTWEGTGSLAVQTCWD
jgi:hypothetical protein